jgi:redox-sensitive bicupin YhaK (pirin superfamily)
MIDVRPFNTLGGANHGWLNAKHHFSFANYYEPHPHADMEIITYVRTGAITHEDSMGNKGRTAAGDVQVMSAGTGVRHAEFNLENETTTLFQIWIETDKPGAPPSWGQRDFPKNDRSGRFTVVASGDPGDEALSINADARILAATLKAGESLTYDLAAGRRAYLVPAVGRVDVNGVTLNARDGAGIIDEAVITITASEDAELVMVDSL